MLERPVRPALLPVDCGGCEQTIIRRKEEAPTARANHLSICAASDRAVENIPPLAAPGAPRPAFHAANSCTAQTSLDMTLRVYTGKRPHGNNLVFARLRHPQLDQRFSTDSTAYVAEFAKRDNNTTVAVVIYAETQ